jgi:hypothetical protein
MYLWHAAHESLVMCTSSFWRLVIGLSVGRSTTAVLTPGGGGGIVRHINASRMNFPRSVGEPDCWFANSDSNPALVSTPLRGPPAGSDFVWKVVDVRPVRRCRTGAPGRRSRPPSSS